MTSTKRLFEASHLGCRRGGRILFQNLSFSLAEGDIAHISGANGSGKTSLLRMLAGALPLYAGKLKWQGKNIGHLEGAAFLPADDRALKPQETVLETLRFWANVGGKGMDADKSIHAALTATGMAALAERPVRVLSSGQKRRLGLARVFLQNAPVWLLDEPVNGLDLASYDLFMDALAAHTSAGGIAIIASHYTIEPPKKGKLVRVDVGVT